MEEHPIRTQEEKRLEDFVDALQRTARRLGELREVSTHELVDLLIDRVWSTMARGTEERALVVTAAERLRFLDRYERFDKALSARKKGDE